MLSPFDATVLVRERYGVDADPMTDKRTIEEIYEMTPEVSEDLEHIMGVALMALEGGMLTPRVAFTTMWALGYEMGKYDSQESN